MLNVKKTLTKILTNLKSPVIVRSYISADVTIAADGVLWVYPENWTPTAITGYTAIGSLQPTPSAQSSFITQVTLVKETYGNRFVGVIRNISTQELTDHVTIPILYIRNDLL